MNEEFAVLLFFFGISGTLNLALAIAWFKANRRIRQLENPHFAPGPLDDGRAERLERSIETLSAQVDQLASGQEFLNRVMADRLDRLARPAAEPEITPH